MERLVVNKLYTEKDTHLGGVAEFGYIHLPNHSELYLTKKISQKFRIFNIPFYIKTSVEMVEVPIEMASLFAQVQSHEEINEHEGVEYKETFIDLDIDAYRKQAVYTADEARAKIKANLLKSTEVDDEQKQVLLANIKADEKYVELLFQDLNKYEKDLFGTFLKSNYKLVYRVLHGSTETFFFARVLADRIMFFNVETMKFKTKNLLANIKSFYVTDKYIKTFLEKIQEKGGNLL